MQTYPVDGVAKRFLLENPIRTIHKEYNNNAITIIISPGFIYNRHIIRTSYETTLIRAYILKRLVIRHTLD